MGAGHHHHGLDHGHAGAGDFNRAFVIGIILNGAFVLVEA